MIIRSMAGSGSEVATIVVRECFNVCIPCSVPLKETFAGDCTCFGSQHKLPTVQATQDWTISHILLGVEVNSCQFYHFPLPPTRQAPVSSIGGRYLQLEEGIFNWRKVSSIGGRYLQLEEGTFIGGSVTCSFPRNEQSYFMKFRESVTPSA